jgi:hypothetical protein
MIRFSFNYALFGQAAVITKLISVDDVLISVDAHSCRLERWGERTFSCR